MRIPPPIPDISELQWGAGYHQNCLHYSIAANDFSKLHNLASTSTPDNIDETDGRFGAPLHLAIYLNNLEAVDILLNAGANPLKEPHFVEEQFITTPIGLAARLDNRNILQKIWQHIHPDADTFTTEEFHSCLRDAAEYGQVATISDLLSWGHNGWTLESKGRALVAAANNWRFENAQFLLSQYSVEQEWLNLALAQVTVTWVCFLRRDHTESERVAQSQSIKVLMDAGADPKSPEASRIAIFEPLIIWTALHKQLYGCLEVLLNNGADPNMTNGQGQTALHYLGAYKRKDPKVKYIFIKEEPHEDAFRLLLRFNASVIHQDVYGNTPLHCAAYASPLDTLHLLLSNLPESQRASALRARNHKGETLLHFASAGGQVEMAKYLLCVGLYVDETASRGWTPFLSALAPGSPNVAGLSKKSEIAQLLLSRGANPVAATQDGWTPLHCLAMHCGSYSTDETARLIEMLVSRGNPVNARASFAFDDPSNRPRKRGGGQDIYCSCRELQYLADPVTWGKVIRHDITPLHIAAEFRAIAIARELLKHGADPAAEDSEGNSPARTAGNSSRRYRSEDWDMMIKLLLDAGGSY
ncbi:ankyrin repeat-containing domain protein [Fusarium flagelliforme]|uniref:Ankyrin repeat protein n=1 Tax=Fusarium flagelliforme TaxID=2675880 RepID=A0A395MQT1_9HYPO|nr:ankyrin repeat-containing domain protein [Fusarium flagelliforme]KAH7189675.1 ankyrin repeat-containing domain protein [Fusarium flagelliforme]RFN50318.1 ankyrin repeat protein [Fusarium flagelliforme]